MIGNRRPYQQEQATNSAMWRGVLFVIFPGLLLVVGLIRLVMPPLPPVSTLNGCYGLKQFPLIRVRPGRISVDGIGIASIPMRVEKGKEGYVIAATPGFSFRTGRQGRLEAFSDFPQGELIPVFISQTHPPSLGLIANGEQVKIPKIDCTR
jgi:hypothetical protein